MDIIIMNTLHHRGEKYESHGNSLAKSCGNTVLFIIVNIVHLLLSRQQFDLLGFNYILLINIIFF